MEGSRPHNNYALKRCEQGFTLAEVMIVIVLMGIVFAIASSSWLGVVESRRVDSATNQLAADLRLAHTSATNQLASWRVVLVPDQEEEDDSPDYYMLKLDPSGTIVAGSEKARTLPDKVKITSSLALSDNATMNAMYTTMLGGSSKPTRTLEFDADGSMDTYPSNPLAADNDLVEVTQDSNPVGQIRFNETTSRIKIE